MIERQLLLDASLAFSDLLCGATLILIYLKRLLHLWYLSVHHEAAETRHPLISLGLCLNCEQVHSASSACLLSRRWLLVVIDRDGHGVREVLGAIWVRPGVLYCHRLNLLIVVKPNSAHLHRYLSLLLPALAHVYEGARYQVQVNVLGCETGHQLSDASFLALLENSKQEAGPLLRVITCLRLTLFDLVNAISSACKDTILFVILVREAGK